MGTVLATSEVVQGLVVQGRTIQETIVIARDVAKRLLESLAGFCVGLEEAIPATASRGA